MRFAIIAIPALLALSGCGEPVDRGACLKPRETIATHFIQVGSVLVPIMTPIMVCDQWEYPNGRARSPKT